MKEKTVFRCERCRRDIDVQGDPDIRPRCGICSEKMIRVGHQTIAVTVRRRRKIPKNKRHRVYARDGFKCVLCGCTENLTLDHITPQSKGGADHIDNLRTLCTPCNEEKGDQTDLVWIIRP